VGRKNRVLDGGPYPPCEKAILSREGAAHYKVQGHSALRCAKTAEPIEMFKTWTSVGLRKHV